MSDTAQLREASVDALIELVEQLQALLAAQAVALQEIVDERDAALLLNELCHY